MSASLHSVPRGAGKPLRERAPIKIRRGGFTLIEMVAVAVIIGILASMIMFAMANARATGQIGNTRVKIAKLDAVISQQWQTYDTRRIEIFPDDEATEQDIRLMRLQALRQVMRMELPDNWADVKVDPPALENASQAIIPPAVWYAYQNYEEAISPTRKFGNAECLYMIVTVGLAGKGLDISAFRERDIGDLDGDGAMEFHDGWGNPIRFLRWPVGFVTDSVHDDSARDEDRDDERMGRLSDVMPPIVKDGDTCWPDTKEHHDPFDYFAAEPFAFRVHPLIYSAGPDQIFDIYSGPAEDDAADDQPKDSPFLEFPDNEPVAIESAPSCTGYDIFAKDDGGSWPSGGAPRYIGRPKDLDSTISLSNGVMNHFDNIHNHRRSEN